MPELLDEEPAVLWVVPEEVPLAVLEVPDDVLEVPAALVDLAPVGLAPYSPLSDLDLLL